MPATNLPIRHRSRRLSAALFAALALLPLFATRAATPLGPVEPVLVESPSQQTSPAVAGNRDGATVIVWTDCQRRTIRARRFAPGGAPLDGGFTVSDEGADRQSDSPAVAMAADGSFAVAWRQIPRDPVTGGFPERGRRIAVRRFRADGSPISAPRLIDAVLPLSQPGEPSIASAANGDFVVAWHSRSLVDLDLDLPSLPIGFTLRLGGGDLRLNAGLAVAQRFGADGEPRGPREVLTVLPESEALVGVASVLLVGAVGAGLEVRVPREVGVAMADDGRYALAWTVELLPTVGLPQTQERRFAASAVRLQRFRSSGLRDGLPQTIDSRIDPTRQSRSAPVLAMNGDGGLAVLWRLSANNAVQVRRYAPNGAAEGPALTLPPPPPRLPGGPVDADNDHAISGIGDGRYVLVWQNNRQHIRAAILGSTAPSADSILPVSSIALEDTTLRSLQSPSIASDGSGGFTTVWADTRFERNSFRLLDSTIDARRYRAQ